MILFQRKFLFLIMLIAATALLVAGCSTSADDGRYDYVPSSAGVGCYFEDNKPMQTVLESSYGIEFSVSEL